MLRLISCAKICTPAATEGMAANAVEEIFGHDYLDTKLRYACLVPERKAIVLFRQNVCYSSHESEYTVFLKRASVTKIKLEPNWY